MFWENLIVLKCCEIEFNVGSVVVLLVNGIDCYCVYVWNDFYFYVYYGY